MASQTTSIHYTNLNFNLNRMKRNMHILSSLQKFRYLPLSMMILSMLFSCNKEDDGMDITPDAPIIQVPEDLTMEGGETLSFSFSVVVPGTIDQVSVSASAGTASIVNEGELISSTHEQAEVSYVTTKDLSGSQTVTLTITDEHGKVSNGTANIEVFAPISYGLALVSGAGDVTTTFLQGMIDLGVSTVDNSAGTELAQFAAIYSDGNSLFTAGFGAPATIGKYVFNSRGEAELAQEILIPGSNSVSAIEIVDENTAYATVGGGLSRAIQFSPSEMRITGEIDLTDAGEGLFYSDLIVRDDVLFIALNDFGSSGEAKVAVVDLTTNTLVKVISDGRTATLFGSLSSAIMAIDEQGDIYVQGSGLYAGKVSGILRIKAGATEFDADYFFDLTASTGGTCFGLYHMEGITFTATSENDDNWFGTDGSNPPFRYRKIDLSTQTDGGDLDPTLPNTFAASSTMFFLQTADDEILFPIAGSDEDALYSYELGTGAVTKKITSTSGYVSGMVLID